MLGDRSPSPASRERSPCIAGSSIVAHPRLRLRHALKEGIQVLGLVLQEGELLRAPLVVQQPPLRLPPLDDVDPVPEGEDLRFELLLL